MSASSKKIKVGDRSRKVLVWVLPVLMIAIAYLISTFGNLAAYVIVLGLLGFIIGVATIFFPIIGFYGAIIFSFFLFDIQRFLNVSLPLGSFVDLLIYLCFLGIIIRKILYREPFWKNSQHVIVFIYFLVFLYSFIQIFNPMGAPWSVSLPIYRRFISLMIFFYCSIQLFNGKKDIYRFLKIYLSLSLIAAGYACYQEWFGYPAYEMRAIMSNPQGERLLSLGGGKYRKFSFFASPTDFGLLMSAVVLVLLPILVYFKMKWLKRIGILAFLILSALAMTYSGTRTATMMLVIGIIMYILMTINNRKTLIFSACFSAIFVILIYGPIYGNATINRLRSAFDLSDDESYKVRDINRHSVQPFIYSNPMGGGLGTSGVGSSAYVPNHPLADFPSDSGLLRNAVEYGWIGILFLYVTYIVVLQQCIRIYFKSKIKENRIIILGAVLSLFGYMVAQYAQVAIGMIPGAFLFYAQIAMIIRLKQMEHDEKLQS